MVLMLNRDDISRALRQSSTSSISVKLIFHTNFHLGVYTFSVQQHELDFEEDMPPIFCEITVLGV